MYPDAPRLLADIGGLYARFALEVERGVLSHPAALRCADHSSLQDVVQAYMDSVRPHRVRHAALAVANPVDGDLVRMTNSPWQFSIEATRQALRLDTLVVVNDFTALAMALPRLEPGDLRQVGGGQAVGNSVVGLIGWGTGLRVSGLIPAGDSFISLGSEGGGTPASRHATPANWRCLNLRGSNTATSPSSVCSQGRAWSSYTRPSTLAPVSNPFKPPTSHNAPCRRTTVTAREHWRCSATCWALRPAIWR